MAPQSLDRGACACLRRRIDASRFRALQPDLMLYPAIVAVGGGDPGGECLRHEAQRA